MDKEEISILPEEDIELDLDDNIDTSSFDDSDTHEAESHDENIASSDESLEIIEDDDLEKKKTTNRLNKQKRNRNIKYKLDRADEIEAQNQILRNELEQIKVRQNQLDNIAKAYQTDYVDKQLQDMKSLGSYYETELKKAYQNNDADSIMAFNKEIYNNQVKMSQVEYQKIQQNAAVQHTQNVAPQQKNPNDDPRVQYQTANFFKEFPWLNDPDNKDDLDFVVSLDKQVYNAGYKPHDLAYWEQLRAKMKTHMPDRFEEGSSMITQKKKSPVGSSVNGSNAAKSGASGGGKRFTSSQAQVLQRMGYLDDDGKTVLNKDKVNEYYQTWNRKGS